MTKLILFWTYYTTVWVSKSVHLVVDYVDQETQLLPPKDNTSYPKGKPYQSPEHVNIGRRRLQRFFYFSVVYLPVWLSLSLVVQRPVEIELLNKIN